MAKQQKVPFWDHRPFTRVVIGYRAKLTVDDYIEINRWEAAGYDRETARTIHQVSKVGWRYWNSV